MVLEALQAFHGGEVEELLKLLVRFPLDRIPEVERDAVVEFLIVFDMFLPERVELVHPSADARSADGRERLGLGADHSYRPGCDVSDAFADDCNKVVAVAVVRIPVRLVAGVGSQIYSERCSARDRDGVALGGELRVSSVQIRDAHVRLRAGVAARFGFAGGRSAVHDSRDDLQHHGVIAVALAVVVIGVAGHQQRVVSLGNGLCRAAAVERDAAGKRAGFRR